MFIQILYTYIIFVTSIGIKHKQLEYTVMFSTLNAEVWNIYREASVLSLKLVFTHCYSVCNINTIVICLISARAHCS